MILGYTLATFPKSHAIYIFMHNPKRNRQENLVKIEIRTLAQLLEKGTCIIGGEYPDNRFSTQQKEN